MKVITRPETRCEHCDGLKEREERKYVSDYSGADLPEDFEYVYVLGFKKRSEKPVPLFHEKDSYHFINFEEEWAWLAEHWEDIKRMQPPGVEEPQDYIAVDFGFTNHMPWLRFISFVEAAWDTQRGDKIYLTEMSLLELLEGKIIYADGTEEGLRIMPPKTDELGIMRTKDRADQLTAHDFNFIESAPLWATVNHNGQITSYIEADCAGEALAKNELKDDHLVQITKDDLISIAQRFLI